MANHKLRNECSKGYTTKVLHFKGERLEDDYIQLCKHGTYMAMQQKKLG
jgi:hypothetical protein